jgi:type IV secretory pathway VirB9-like protein
MYTDIEPMMASRITTRIDYIPNLRLVNFNYGAIYDVMGRT